MDAKNSRRDDWIEAANVIFSGLAPGFVGVYQVNVEIPPDAPVGPEIPLDIAVGIDTSVFRDPAQRVTIAVD